MTNLERLILKMGNRKYFSDAEYTILLEENGLDATATYNKDTDYLPMLQTELAILQSLANNIDYFRSIETEFSTTSSAYKNLNDRIQNVENRIAQMPNYEPTSSCITFLYHN